MKSYITIETDASFKKKKIASVFNPSSSGPNGMPTMRMISKRVQFGSIVLLCLFLGQYAFIAHVPLTKHFTPTYVGTPRSFTSTATTRFSGWRIQNSRTSSTESDESNNPAHALLQDVDAAVEATQVSPNRRNLPWIVMFVSLVFTQIFVGTPNVDSLNTSNNVVYSAVSATMLKGVSKGRLSWKMYAAIAVIMWHMSHSAMAAQVLKLVVVACSKFGEFYMTQLTANPLITKSITTGAIGFAGDYVAQTIERIRATNSAKASLASQAEGSSLHLRHDYDRRRALSVILDGCLISGPLLHFSYNWLESLIPVHSATGLAASASAISQVLIDDFFLDAMFVAIMFVTTGIGEGHAKQIIPQFKKDFIPTIKASWATSIFLMPLEFVCFRFLPLSFRVLGMNVIDIFWGAMVSFMAHRNRKAANRRALESSAATASGVDQPTVLGPAALQM